MLIQHSLSSVDLYSSCLLNFESIRCNSRLHPCEGRSAFYELLSFSDIYLSTQKCRLAKISLSSRVFLFHLSFRVSLLHSCTFISTRFSNPHCPTVTRLFPLYAGYRTIFKHLNQLASQLWSCLFAKVESGSIHQAPHTGPTHCRITIRKDIHRIAAGLRDF
jgi:hypothetical protein